MDCVKSCGVCLQGVGLDCGIRNGICEGRFGSGVEWSLNLSDL